MVSFYICRWSTHKQHRTGQCYYLTQKLLACYILPFTGSRAGERGSGKAIETAHLWQENMVKAELEHIHCTCASGWLLLCGWVCLLVFCLFCETVTYNPARLWTWSVFGDGLKFLNFLSSLSRCTTRPSSGKLKAILSTASGPSTVPFSPKQKASSCQRETKCKSLRVPGDWMLRTWPPLYRLSLGGRNGWGLCLG